MRLTLPERSSIAAFALSIVRPCLRALSAAVSTTLAATVAAFSICWPAISAALLFRVSLVSL
jgi:hypothetical protein